MAITLGILAGIGWASAIVTVRIVINRTNVPNDLGALLTLSIAGVSALVVAAITRSAFDFGWSNIGGLFLVGLISPGLAQLTYFIAISSIGPSRAGIFIGVAPVWSVFGAYLFSDGEINASIVIGTLLVVFGGGLLSSEKTKEQLKILGITAGLVTAFCFGVRDVISDKIITDDNLNSAFSAGILWLAGVPTILAYMLIRVIISNRAQKSPSLPADSSANPPANSSTNPPVNLKSLLSFFNKDLTPILIPGIIQGVALCAMLEAFKRGRVEIIAPISNSFATIGVVLIALVFLGQREINFKIVFSMVLVAAGAVLVSSFG